MQIIQSTKNSEHLTRVVGGACGITDLPSSGGHPFQKQGQHNGEWPLTSQQCLSYTSHPGHYKYIKYAIRFYSFSLSFFLSLFYLLFYQLQELFVVFARGWDTWRYRGCDHFRSNIRDVITVDTEPGCLTIEQDQKRMGIIAATFISISILILF